MVIGPFDIPIRGKNHPLGVGATVLALHPHLGDRHRGVVFRDALVFMECVQVVDVAVVDFTIVFQVEDDCLSADHRYGELVVQRARPFGGILPERKLNLIFRQLGLRLRWLIFGRRLTITKNVVEHSTIDGFSGFFRAEVVEIVFGIMGVSVVADVVHLHNNRGECAQVLVRRVFESSESVSSFG